MFLFTISVSFVTISSTLAYPFGAPACVDAPRHGGEPQADLIDIDITKDVSQFSELGMVTITIGSDDAEETFKGFLVKTKAPGEFVQDPTDPVAKLECNGALGSDGADTKAVTHVDGGDKKMVNIYFQSDQGAEVVPEFEVIILKNYSTYWTELIY